LLIASIFQVGVLWSVNNEGFTIPFITGAASNPEIGARPYRQEVELSDFSSVILNPYRVTISDGGQYTQVVHYLVSRKTELFSVINARCRAFFDEIISIEAETEIPIDKWGDLVSERGVLVEYRTAIPQEIVVWLSGRNGAVPGAPAAISKLLIIPEEHAGRQTICLYVLTDDSIVKLVSETASYYEIQKIINDNILILSGQGGPDAAPPDAVRFMTINEVGGGIFQNFSPDVFCVVDGPATNAFRRIKYAAPADVRDKSELESIILTTDMYSYSRSVEYSGDMVFKNITNIYRLYSGGLMEYNYLPMVQPADKGGMTKALEHAVIYIMNIERQLLGSADLILSGIYVNESDSTYRFTFDYILDDFPVYFYANQTGGPAGGGYTDAISIHTNANRVVSCRWMLVDLFFASESRQFHIYFDRIDVGRSLTKMAVSDIAIAYVVNLTPPEGLDGGFGEIYNEWPVWAITSPDGVVETVGLSEG